MSTRGGGGFAFGERLVPPPLFSRKEAWLVPPPLFSRKEAWLVPPRPYDWFSGMELIRICQSQVPECDARGLANIAHGVVKSGASGMTGVGRSIARHLLNSVAAAAAPMARGFDAMPDA